MGRRQVVRQRVLVSPFLGSNPSGPVSNEELVSKKKLILFDFDGVIIDGINEYWSSSLLASKKYLLPYKIEQNFNIQEKVSSTFVDIRPWVKYGWEMVLITHEIIKKNDPLNHENKNQFIQNYKKNCREILKKNLWEPKILQTYLDKARECQISDNFEKWIELHRPFTQVVEFIRKAKKNNYQIGIITTKRSTFTLKILNNFNIYSDLIFGYESGSKIKIISKLKQEFEIVGFLEDRRQTLINIRNNSETKHISCFLADWGYLKKSDRINLPNEIKLIKLTDLEDILANSN